MTTPLAGLECDRICRWRRLALLRPSVCGPWRKRRADRHARSLPASVMAVPPARPMRIGSMRERTALPISARPRVPATAASTSSSRVSMWQRSRRPIRRCEKGSFKRAVRVGMTWFAPDGPYAKWVGSDAIIQAMSAVSYATGAKDGMPMLPRGHAPQVVAGATACIAALGAIIGRDAGWRGRRIDLNVFDANLCFSESGAAAVALTGDRSGPARRQPFHADISRRHLSGERRLDRRHRTDRAAMDLVVRHDRAPGSRQGQGSSGCPCSAWNAPTSSTLC